MSKFNLDLSKFKKIAHDKNSATLQHRDGHQIKLATSALKPEMREKLAALPLSKLPGMSEDKMGDGSLAPSPMPPQMPSVQRLAKGGRAHYDEGSSTPISPEDYDNQQAAAQQAIGQLQQQSAAIRSQIAMRNPPISPEDYDKQQAAKYGTSSDTIINVKPSPTPPAAAPTSTPIPSLKSSPALANMVPAAYKADGGPVDAQKKTLGAIINYPGASASPSPDQQSPQGSPDLAQGGGVPPQSAVKDLPPQSAAKDLPPQSAAKDIERLGPGAPSLRPAEEDFARGGNVRKRYADGTPDQPVSSDDQGVDTSPEAMQQGKNITINVGPPQQQPDSQDMAYHIGDAVRQSLADTVQAAKTVGTPIVNAAGQFARGVVGAPSSASQDQQQPQTANGDPSTVVQMPPAISQADAPPQQQKQAPVVNDPYGTGAYENAYMQGLGNQIAGTQAEIAPMRAQGAAQAQSLKDSATNQKEDLDNYGSWVTRLDTENEALMQDIGNGHIDPNHYLNSQGTGQKIATGIGLILGGMGGGLTHQGNPALQFLNNQIDRDIDAQKADIGIKQNLLSANIHQFGNARDAADMTKAQQLSIVAAQLQKAAAQQSGPLAAARAQQAIGQLQQQSAAIRSQIAMRKTLLGSANAGRADPARVVNMVIPQGPEREEANKELIEAQNTTNARDNLLSAFDKTAQLNTVRNHILSPIQSQAQIDALKSPLLAAMSKGTAGRFTEADAGMLEPLWPKLTDDAQTLAQKRQQMSAIASEKMHFPKLEAWGLQPKTWGRYPNGGASRMQFTPAQ